MTDEIQTARNAAVEASKAAGSWAVLSGPGCQRRLTLQDGTVYDCKTPPEDARGMIPVASHEHQQELMHLVSLHYHHHGHPHHDDPTEAPFRYDAALAPIGFDASYQPHSDNSLRGL